jgi:predicted RNA-binding protein with PIN domain
MALVRILVDGYSLLHNWPELANGHARHSAIARDALIRRLTHYQDAVGTPITIFFDGAGRRGPAPPHDAEHSVEVLFSQNGKTADQMIERAAHRFAAWGEVLAVTNDFAERDTVVAMGGFTSPCRDFIRAVEEALGEQTEDIHHHNRRERNRYHRRH